ncbi:hypothetical protein Gotri_011914 [Gossypium trilobum]|uniref:Uncharacterized protein n=1 Tax=Gossypium trilobum TaxID=34281 RepID=A0A7J9DNH4_9ROSI|nr:hypothetical protein [Gossypium trilobum]
MASATNSYLSNVISHLVHHHGFIQQKTATTFMNFLLRHLKDSESTCPLLLTTPSFKKSWDADLELQTGYMVVDDIVNRALAESSSEFERINNGMVAKVEMKKAA